MKIYVITTLSIFIICSGHVCASPTQQRITKDIADGKHVVIQVVVALADNENQWIVPVPEALGNGQDARSNLYWGALYGVKTYLTRKAGWQKLISRKVEDKRILERVVLKKDFIRDGRSVTVYLVADAWDGRYIIETIEQFLRYNAGYDGFNVQLHEQNLGAGGSAHLIAYIGHNALMDYGGAKDLTVSNPGPAKSNPENDAIVLACKSQPYFSSRLEKVAAHPLVMTSGLMAPEAYSLDAAITQWIKGASDTQVRKASANSYNKYQKTGVKAAERLFGVK